MLYILLGVTVSCLLLCLAELLVHVWESADNRAKHRSTRQTGCAAQLPARLPERETIGCLYALSEQFADHFQALVRS